MASKYKENNIIKRFRLSFLKATINIIPILIVYLLTGLYILTPKNTFAAIAGDCNNDNRVDVLDFQLLSNTFGKSPGQSGYNPACDFNSSGSIDILDFQILANNFNTQTPTNTPTISPATNTPTRIPTSPPNTPTRTPTSGPIPTQPPVSNWGIYPNCVAPAMPVEAQSWWLQGEGHRIGDAAARHIHAAGCFPNARDTTGNMVRVSGTFEYTRMILIHNSNITIYRGDNGFPETGPSAIEFPLRFDPQLVCPNHANCTFYSTNRINTTVAPDGLHELRWRIQGRHPDVGNDEDFISFATKLYVKNGNTVNSSADNASPRARGWYEAVEYDTAEISNYVGLYNGRTDITVPIVRGIVPLTMNHTQSVGASLRSRLYLDPNFHAGSHGTLLYDKPGLFRGTYSLDTTRIPNGRHVLVVETANSAAQGTHSGILKLFIDVNN